MKIRCWRAAAMVLLAASLAQPTTTVAATHAAPATSRRTIQTSSGTASAPRPKAKRRRARRAPPGGVWSRHAIVVDPATGQVLYEKNAGRSVPIASITKLMTALVFLEQRPDLDRLVEVTRQELTGGGHTQLRNRERVALRDLLHMSLMVSDNVATRVLARESGLAPEDFLAAMNRRALELGMTHTRFVETTGLDERNVSTASDVATLLKAAASEPTIRAITTLRSHEFRSATRPHVIGNTNRLLYGQYEVLGGKTGFISAAGYCFTTWIRSQGRDLIAVVLGAPTNATRFADVVRLVQRTSSASIAPSQP
uniref:D-alanyl-D-alanine carboxypeptidase n=1 Tax=Eiseniibacteriota bacterium TaxID=2212470 RepID=A0A832I4K5_UNCEI